MVIVTAYSADAVTDIQIKCDDSAADIAAVCNKVRAYLHPNTATDDGPYHAAMQAVADEWDRRKREKRRKEHG